MFYFSADLRHWLLKLLTNVNERKYILVPLRELVSPICALLKPVSSCLIIQAVLYWDLCHALDTQRRWYCCFSSLHVSEPMMRAVCLMLFAYGPALAADCIVMPRLLNILPLSSWPWSGQSKQQKRKRLTNRVGCLVGLLFNPEDRDSTFLRNVVKFYHITPRHMPSILCSVCEYLNAETDLLREENCMTSLSPLRGIRGLSLRVFRLHFLTVVAVLLPFIGTTRKGFLLATQRPELGTLMSIHFSFKCPTGKNFWFEFHYLRPEECSGYSMYRLL